MPKKRGVNVDKAREKLEEIKKGSTRFWTPKVAMNLIRILPPFSGEDWYKEAWFHFSIGVDRKPLACPRRMMEEDCYICEEVDKLRKSDDPRDADLATQIAARRRIFCNIVDMDDVESGVQIFSFGVTIFKDLLTYVADADWGDITDPEDGYDITIEREGKGIETNYTTRAKKNSTPLIDMDLLEELHDLDELIEVLPYDKLKAIYEGEEFVEEEVEKKGKPKVRRTPRVEEEGEATIEKDKGEEEEVEDEEAEEKECFEKDYNELDPVCLSCEDRADCRQAFFSSRIKKEKKGSGTKSEKIAKAAREIRSKLKK